LLIFFSEKTLAKHKKIFSASFANGSWLKTISKSPSSVFFNDCLYLS
jgi:hypothetical protein